jgi:predicted unusual protein kinase regulating ubiquinone biosynthesis (AarF/ABC1/UbiB family)
MSLLYRYPIIARRWRLFELHHHAPTRSPLYLARPCSTLLFPCMDFYSRIWVHPENNNNEHVLASSPTSSNPQQYISTEYRFLQAYRRVADFFQRLKQFLIDAFFVSLRSTEIVLRCSPFMILVPASIFSPSKALSSYIHRLSWKYGLFTIQQLGPAFIKLFQWAATRRDLFPAYFCDELSQLHDTAYLHTWNQSHLILQREFGKDYASTLRMDDPHSTHSVIGSGSAAQVYRAKIFDPVTEKERLVAVKILHPGVRESMERDLMFMKRIASLLGMYLPFHLFLDTFWKSNN